MPSFELVIYLENTRVRWHFPKPSGRHLRELFVSVADELLEPSLTGETPSLLYASISGVTFPWNEADTKHWLALLTLSSYSCRRSKIAAFGHTTQHSQKSTGCCFFFLSRSVWWVRNRDLNLRWIHWLYKRCVAALPHTAQKNIETAIYPCILSHLTEQYRLGGYLRCHGGRFTAVQSETVQDVYASLYTLSIISTAPSEVKVHWYYV